jgi:hypothetical protein
MKLKAAPLWRPLAALGEKVMMAAQGISRQTQKALAMMSGVFEF